MLHSCLAVKTLQDPDSNTQDEDQGTKTVSRLPRGKTLLRRLTSLFRTYVYMQIRLFVTKTDDNNRDRQLDRQTIQI